MKTGSVFLAARYAVAYDGLAKTNDEARESLLAYQKALAALKDAAEYITNPTLPFSAKEEILAKILGKNKAAAFIKLLAAQKRFSLAAQIGDELQKLLDNRLGVKRAIITTAAAQQPGLEAVLSKYFNAQIIAAYESDKDLLAGFTIRQGDIYIDASAAGRVKQLQKSLTGK